MQNDSTAFEYTLSGIDLGKARCRILALNIAYNNSLLSIHMPRKQISDYEGITLAHMLYTNKKLRKLELEGNLLGPKSAAAFGQVLKVNKTLKFLDLESNQLTADGQDMASIYSLVEFLDHNNTLLSLNLANNQMDAKCGDLFRMKIAENHTLIDFDFSMNSFTLEDSRAI